MDLSVPISSLMTTNLVTVPPDAKLQTIKDLMEVHSIHHIPVVAEGELKGIVSDNDLRYFLKGLAKSDYQKLMNEIRLKNYNAKDIMVTQLESLNPDDSLLSALHLFKQNRFKAIPVVEGKSLVGIITTYDIVEWTLKNAYRKV